MCTLCTRDLTERAEAQQQASAIAADLRAAADAYDRMAAGDLSPHTPSPELADTRERMHRIAVEAAQAWGIEERQQ